MTLLSLFFFMQEGDRAKPKTLSTQKLSPKWCFLDCEYHPPLELLTVSDCGLMMSFSLLSQWRNGMEFHAAVKTQE